MNSILCCSSEEEPFELPSNMKMTKSKGSLIVLLWREKHGQDTLLSLHF